MKTKYNSPRLDRPLISSLYHSAKAEGILVTKLASRWIAKKLATTYRPLAKPKRFEQSLTP